MVESQKWTKQEIEDFNGVIDNSPRMILTIAIIFVIVTIFGGIVITSKPNYNEVVREYSCIKRST